MTPERRNRRRYDVCLSASCDGPGGNENARITDISMSGCYVDSIIDVSKGQFLQMGIKLPSGEWLSFSGQVAYAFPRIGFGFEFDELDEEMSATLRKIIGQLQGPDEQQTSRFCA